MDLDTNRHAGSGEWVDAEDAPELDAAFIAEADHYREGRLVRRGRPPTGMAKASISIRLDRDVVNALSETGPGWQSRINGLLRRMLGLEPV